MVKKTNSSTTTNNNTGAAMVSPEEVGGMVGLTAAGVRRGELRKLLPWTKIGHRTLRCPREAVERLVRGA